MRVIRHVAELQQLADRERSLGRSIGLVPTMGALHAGHLSLVEQARRRTDRVWLSIFVNPSQFDDPKDMDAYPSTFEADLRACRAAGVDVVFAPGADEMYDPDSQTWVDVDEITLPLCGAARPGHFRGVITIVTKLLLAAKPHVAVFGEKDFQQLAVIRRMVRDLGFDVEIVAGPIVREADGLALSSRNVNLDAEARRQALVLCQALDAAERAVAAGETRSKALLQLVRQEIGKAPRAEIEYAELRDPESLEVAPPELARATLLALAVFIRPPGAAAGTTVRLIDNRVLHPQP
ncbi:MAG: pantoate--beta-alanine ligase [Deltaproteobacteria bacterium]|nr:MAG: pantoate--beta-alanine ligase [Deltaproteobacteria bacterium]